MRAIGASEGSQILPRTVSKRDSEWAFFSVCALLFVASVVGMSAFPAGTAWRHGVRLGLHCSCCCAGPMAILLVIGMMDMRAMAVVTVAITAERLAPMGERIARAIGAVTIAAGFLLIARGAGLH